MRPQAMAAPGVAGSWRRKLKLPARKLSATLQPSHRWRRQLPHWHHAEICGAESQYGVEAAAEESGYQRSVARLLRRTRSSKRG